jgi:hypothetical protein
MDYNNIESRLEKIYASMGERFSYGQAVLDATYTEITDNCVSISFFIPNDKYKVLNQINSIIANLANIKDCLRKKLTERSDNPQLIEDEINISPYLQIIIDLSNQEKHGYPLTRPSRSGKDPLIKNISRSLSPSNNPDNIKYENDDGSVAMNVMAKITADITDSEGNFLYRLDKLVENTLDVWEQVIKKYSLDQKTYN